MTSDFYFRKWKKTLSRIEQILYIDIAFQEAKAHEQRRCDAVQRMSGILGAYISQYNEAMDSLRNNLQIQKFTYIKEIIHAIHERIIELKKQISKLECSNYQFLGHGLIQHKMTTDDAEFTDISTKIKRSDGVTAKIQEVMGKVKAKKEAIEKLALEDQEEEEAIPVCDKWWDNNENTNNTREGGPKGTDFTKIYEVVKQYSEETLRRRGLVAMIQAHEKSRQLIRRIRHQKEKRKMWEKELSGTLQPQARQEIRERAAKIIEKVQRHYMQLKRVKIENCKRDQLLGITLCDKANAIEQKFDEVVLKKRTQYVKAYEEQCAEFCKKIKQQYELLRTGDIQEDFRDRIRYWFEEWHKGARYFYDIPKEKVGGSTLVITEDVPTPAEWLEEYKAYLIKKNSKINKNTQQQKWEEKMAKKEGKRSHNEKQKQKKEEQILMRKIMRDPKLHPGFSYPECKKTEHIFNVKYPAIKAYHDDWDKLDILETIDVKERFVKDIEVQNIVKDVKIGTCKSVDNHMRTELKALKKALKKDYQRSEDPMPEKMKTKKKKRPRKNKLSHFKIPPMDDRVAEMLEDLTMKGFVGDYPNARKTFVDFKGDHNFAGDDYRCTYKVAPPFYGETRDLWWEKCCEVCRGSHRILIVGPKRSGKCTLVDIMTSVNDAVLFVLDPETIGEDMFTPVYLQRLVDSVATCAKAVQPAIIFVKHVHNLFMKKDKKTAEREKANNLKLFRLYFIRKLFKKIHKTDRITIVGSCSFPWQTKSKGMVKQFRTILLMPYTSYSTVHQLLRDWVVKNPSIPGDLNISSLAYVLQGHPYGYLEQSLQTFLSPDRIVKIAAHGLIPEDIYDHIIEYDTENVSDYMKYQKWYSDRTPWGRKEKKDLKEQMDFRERLEKYEAQKKKDKKRQR